MDTRRGQYIQPCKTAPCVNIILISIAEVRIIDGEGITLGKYVRGGAEGIMVVCPCGYQTFMSWQGQAAGEVKEVYLVL